MMTYVLCYGHQIVFSPTSLPTPVCVAEEYAKRGRNLYNSWISEASNGQINGANGNGMTYEELTLNLGHQYHQKLNSFRVNA